MDQTRMPGVLEQLRNTVPLIQAITNYVTIGDCANILLAYGGSPAMVETASEAYDFARIASGVYINIGTLSDTQEAASAQAMMGARDAGRPVVVDPVGCGAIPRRAQVLEHLAATGCVHTIKGNAGEIMVLAGMQADVKGMDSAGEAGGVGEAAVSLAQRLGCTVVATGPVDIITDGTRLVQVHNGVDLLTRITGAGCMLGMLCTATAAICPEDGVLAAATAVVSMGLAGEIAAETAKAPGSFRVALMDAIYSLTPRDLLERGKVVC